MTHRTLALSLALALPACAATRSPPSPASETVEARSPDAPIHATLRIVGHDGRPLAATHVTVSRNHYVDPLVDRTFVGETLELELPGPGAYRLRFAGVDHAELEPSLQVERSLELDLRLGTYAFDAARKPVLRIRWVDGAGHHDAPRELVGHPLGEQRFGFALVAPLDARAIHYQLVAHVPDERTFNGPGGTTWVYDGEGDFWAVRSWSNDQQLELDLAALPPPGRAAQLELSPGVIASRRDEAWQLLDDYQVGMRMLFAARLMPGEFEATALELAEDARATIEAIDDAALRSTAALEWAWFFGQGGPELLPVETLRAVLGLVAPEDPAWVFVAGMLDDIFVPYAGDAWLRDYRAALLVEQRDPGLLAQLHFIELRELVARGDDDEAAARYALLARDYAGSEPQWRARVDFDPERPLLPGRWMPAWQLAALGGETIGSAQLAGRPYMLHVWASWCGPCIDEMHGLHDAWQQLGATRSPVAFVSIDLDDSLATLEAVRQDWPMPWTNVHVPEDEQRALHRAWAFDAVPLHVLVDAEGTIVGVYQALGSGELLAALQDLAHE